MSSATTQAIRVEPASEQLQLSSPVLITVDFKVDLMWTPDELQRHLLVHFLGLLGDIPQLIERSRSRG